MFSFFTRIVNSRRWSSVIVFLLFLVPAYPSLAEGENKKDSVTHAMTLVTGRMGSFSAITYNVAGLPAFICSAVTERTSSIAEIGRRLNAFDIAHVQEDFNYNKFLYQKGNTHPHRTRPKGKVPFGDGLNTLSRFPVHGLKRVRWTACSGADCLTPKGFSYTRIEVAKDVYIDFYNVHATAYNHRNAAEARQKNMRQLSDFIRANSGENAVIVMGDLNAHYGFFYDNVKILVDENALEDVWMNEKCAGKYPLLSKMAPSDDILSLTENGETIDKILFRSSALLKLSASEYRLESLLFSNENGMPLSDHHPVSARFTWSLLNSPLPELTARIK